MLSKEMTSAIAAESENNKWRFSATDIVRAINNEPDYTKAGNYWRWLKRKLKQEGVELVSGTHGFKFEAPDGKQRKADVLDSEGVTLLAKHYSNNRANDFLDWFTYSGNTLDGQSRKKAYQLYESGLLKSLEPGSIKCLQQIHAYIFAIVFVLFPMSVAAEDETVSDFESMKAQASAISIPLVNITTDLANVTKAEYTQGTIEIFDLQARTGNEQTMKMNCKVKYRGISSFGYDKKSFAIKTLDANGEKCDVDIFGIRADDSWILDAMAIDRLRMRNRLCFDLWNEISRTPYDTDYGNRNGTKGVFVELFINGDYHGLYCMTDKINRKLLGLKKVKENEEGSVSVRGVLYKGESWTHATQLHGYDDTQPYDTDTWNGWELQYPDDYPSIDAWQPLMDFIDVFQLSSTAFASVYDEHLYADNLIDYALLVMSTNYGDNMMKNTFLSNPNTAKGTQFLVTPWDMDMSLGGYYNGEYYDVLADISILENSALFYALLNDNIGGFKDDLIDKWKELSKTVFSPDSVFERIDSYVEMFTTSGAWQREYAKWNGNPVPLYEDVADEASYVKDWYARNFKNVCSIFGVETGIANVAARSLSEKNTVYTLGGVKLDSRYTIRGIVIQNGKKVLKK